MSATVLVEYFTTDDRTLVFIVRGDMDAPHVHPVMTSQSELRTLVAERFGRKGLGAIRALDPDAWQAGFRALLEPIEVWSEPGDLVWLVPHDVLHYLPLHAIDLNGQPLIERNPVCYTPSASVMSYCRDRHTGRRDGALVLGDSLGDLPHAREEAHIVAGLFGREPWCGPMATKSALQQELATRPERIDVLHLACHGRFDADEPLRSYLQLAPEADRSSSLTAEEIVELNLRADLVTLSACQSGVNLQHPGDELIGLTRSLLYAGAASVLVSLWSVNDLSTRILMRSFYRSLLDGTVTKAEALRRAQMALRRLTAGELLTHCKKELAKLPATAEPERRLRLAADVADAMALAHDYAGAATAADRARTEFGTAVPATSAVWRELEVRIEVWRFMAEGDQPAAHHLTPFAQPYHWAPFVLIGDWR